MSKPPSLRVDSDDLVIVLAGAAYHPHEGEWVELLPIQTVAEIQAVSRFARISVEYAAAEGDPDAQQRFMVSLEAPFAEMCRALAYRVLAWSWTDAAGHPLPQPNGTPEPLQALSAAEIMWLLNQVQGEAPEERKNGSRPSLTTSSATALPGGPRRSSGGRSRTRP